MGALAEHGGTLLLAGERPWVPAGRSDFGAVPITLARPSADERREHWSAQLGARGVIVPAEVLEALSGRFRLGPDQIGEAVATACERARLKAPTPRPGGAPAPSGDDLFAAARGQAGHHLAAVARRVEPVSTWEDIVLPGPVLAQLHDLCAWVKQRDLVLGRWGFDRRLSQGPGVNALFAGPSGVGKTMAAEVIARELGLESTRSTSPRW